MRIFILSFLVFSLAHAEHSLRQGKFGVRLGAGGAGYVGALDNTANRTAADLNGAGTGLPDSRKLPDYTKYVSAGWVVPVQLELTYGVTNAFELLLAANTTFSGALYADDKYFMKYFNMGLGYRYYFNSDDPIQAYMSSQLGIALTEFLRLEGKSAFGFLFAINDTVGIFLEGDLMLTGLYNSDSSIGKGFQVGAGAMTGLALHF